MISMVLPRRLSSWLKYGIKSQRSTATWKNLQRGKKVLIDQRLRHYKKHPELMIPVEQFLSKWTATMMVYKTIIQIEAPEDFRKAKPGELKLIA